MTKVAINLGYDRTTNPGIPQTLSILPFNPFQNPVPVAADFVQAGFQGVQAFVNDLGGLAPASTLAPTLAPTGPSTLAKGPQNQSLTNSPSLTNLPNSVLKLGGADKLTNKISGQTTTPNTKATRPTPLKDLAELAASTLPKFKPGNLFKPHTKLSESTGTTPGSGTTPPAGENPPAGTSSEDAAA